MLYALSSLILCSLIIYCSTLISKIIEFSQILELMLRISTQHPTPLCFDDVLLYDVRYVVFEVWLGLELVEWFVYWLYSALAGHVGRLSLGILFEGSFGMGSGLLLVYEASYWSIFVGACWDSSQNWLLISAEVGSRRNLRVDCTD